MNSGNILTLATYSIWNGEEGMPNRYGHMLAELSKVDADILCLQEVKDSAMADEIGDRLGMDYSFNSRVGDEDGIAIFSTYPIVEEENWMVDAHAQYVQILCYEKTVGVVNVHLPWGSALERERSVVNLMKKLESKNYDYLFFMGDFNCGDNSDVIRMLLGECTLYGTEANPQFFDLAAGYARISGIPARDTLDFFNNPRYKKNSIEVSSRVDRIFLQNTFPNELPAVLMCDIFGTEVYEEIGLAASDHYGVYAKVGF